MTNLKKIEEDFMKKIFSFLLISVIGVTLLVGCGKKSEFETSASYKKKMATQIYKGEKKIDEEIELEVLMYKLVDNIQRDPIARKEYYAWEEAFIKYADFDKERFDLIGVWGMYGRFKDYKYFTNEYAPKSK